MLNANTFDIRNFLDRLIRTKEKNKFICPVCSGKNLSIKPNSAAYKCWNGCESKDIREALSPLDKDTEKFDRLGWLAAKKQQEKLDRELLAKQANSMAIEDRNKHIRAIAKYLGLSNRHCLKLKQIGLSDEFISERLFFSVDNYSNLPASVPLDFPGVVRFGDRLKFAIRSSALAYVAFNAEGKAIGLQFRLDEPPPNSKLRYLWASSERYGGSSPHLPNGELPITVTGNCQNTAYAIESFGKSSFSSELHGIYAIGAAGGIFSGSKQQVIEATKGCDRVIIVADGGDIAKKGVVSRQKNQYEFFKSLGKEVFFLWWNQLTKAEDIDEIGTERFKSAKLITLDEYLAIAREHGVNLSAIEDRSEPEKILSDSGYQVWIESRKFTPDITIEQEFLNFDIPRDKGIIGNKAPMGSGKTEDIFRYLRNLDRDTKVENEKRLPSLLAGSRNCLLINSVDRANRKFDRDGNPIEALGFYHYQSEKRSPEFSLLDSSMRVAMCLDSLLHFEPESIDGGIVIIDEAVSVIKHLVLSPTIKKFELIKNRFAEIIKRAKQVICLDGNLADWVIDFLSRLAPEKEVLKIENTYQPKKANTLLLDGTVDIREKVRPNDRTPLIKQLEAEKKPLIITDSQIYLELLTEYLAQKKKPEYQILRVDSTTTSSKSVKEFLQHPDRYIQENQLSALGLSPTCESGIDISIKNHFTGIYAFFFGVIDTATQLQMLARARDMNIPRYIWCKEFIFSEEKRRSPNIDSIKADRLAEIQEEFKLLQANKEIDLSQLEALKAAIERSIDPFSDLADSILANREFEDRNCRACLKLALEASGYPVEFVRLEVILEREQINRAEKNLKNEIKIQKSNDIFNAHDKFIEQENITLSFDASYQDRCAKKKASIEKQLPGIIKSKIWDADFIKAIVYDEPHTIQRNELYYLTNNLPIAKKITQAKYRNILERGSIPDIWRSKQSYLKNKLLHDLGIVKLLEAAIANPDFIWQDKSSEIQEIFAKAKLTLFSSVFGARGKSPIKYVNKHITRMGIKIKSKRARIDDAIERHYFIDRQYFNSNCRLEILSAIERKFMYYAARIDEKNLPRTSDPHVDFSPEIFTPNFQGENQGVSQSGKELEGDPHVKKFCIKKSEDVDRYTTPSDPPKKHTTNALQTNLATDSLDENLEGIEPRYV